MRDFLLLSSSLHCHRCHCISRRLLLLNSSASSSGVFEPIYGQQRRFLRQSPLPERQRNYYEVIGVSRTATQKEIRDAYISQSKKLHPDRVAISQSPLGKTTAGHEKFQELQEAYDVLRKPTSRTEYDRKLSEAAFSRHNPTNPHQHWAEYQQWKSQQYYNGAYSQRQQQQQQSWRMNDDPWEEFRRAREQRYNEYQKYYAKQQEQFRARGGINDSPALALFRFFLIITFATIIAHILQYNIYKRASETKQRNLVEKSEIARSYMRQAHIKRGLENGLVYPTEEEIAHILKQDIDDQALMRAETRRPGEIREEERWMTAVMRDQRR